MGVKEIIAKVVSIINSAFDWIKDPDNQESVQRVLEFILTLVTATGVLNEAIPKRDRPKVVRTTMEIFQKLSPNDLREMANIKEETDIDSWSNNDLDMRIAMAISGFVKVDREKRGKAS